MYAVSGALGLRVYFDEADVRSSLIKRDPACERTC